MNPAKYDFNMYSGDSYSWRFILWKDDDKTDPTDLVGATVESQIRDRPGGAIVRPLNCDVTLPNIVDVSMEPDMYATCPLKGVWDLQITFSDGQVNTPIGGSVNVTPDVTNPYTSAMLTTLQARAVLETIPDVRIVKRRRYS